MISAVVALIIVGVALYLIGLVPMDTRIKQAIYALVILMAVLYVIGILTGHNYLGRFGT